MKEKFIVIENSEFGTADIIWWARSKEEAETKAQLLADRNSVCEDEPRRPLTTYLVAEILSKAKASSVTENTEKRE